MTERRHATLHEAAVQMLDTLRSGERVTLQISAQDEASGALLCLITELHQAAKEQHLSIAMSPVGDHTLTLTLAGA